MTSLLYETYPTIISCQHEHIQISVFLKTNKFLHTNKMNDSFFFVILRYSHYFDYITCKYR